MKLELQSGNAKFESILALFHPVWSLNLMYDLKKWAHFYATFIFVHHLMAIGEFILELQTGSARFRSKSSFFGWCDLEIWWMTSKNNRAPLLRQFNLCASFCSHLWIATGVAVRKRSIQVNIFNFLAPIVFSFYMILNASSRSCYLLSVNYYCQLYCNVNHTLWQYARILTLFEWDWIMIYWINGRPGFAKLKTSIVV